MVEPLVSVSVPAVAVETDRRPVLGVNRIAVAVGLQNRTVGIEHAGAGEREIIHGREADAAGRGAARIDDAVDRDAAVVDGDIDVVRLKLITDSEIRPASGRRSGHS